MTNFYGYQHLYSPPNPLTALVLQKIKTRSKMLKCFKGQGCNSTEVIEKHTKLESGIEYEQIALKTFEFLKDKFDKGFFNGSTKNGRKYYNLSKITIANKGPVDLERLAPGLNQFHRICKLRLKSLVPP